MSELPLAEELGRVYAQMSGFVLSEKTIEISLHLVTSLALETFDGSIGAGVTLIDGDGRKTSAGATNELVAEADDLQYRLNEGPCLTACGQLALVRMDDVQTDSRWPRWREAAQDLGVRSTLSAPLVFQGRALGAVKVYGREAGCFDERSDVLLGRFADQAAILLTNVSGLSGVDSQDQADRLSDRLRQALRARNSIALASGILMERHGVSEEAAFLRLVESARVAGRELVAEAAEVIESATREVE